LYEAVRVGTAITWGAARTAARARGAGWDLATVTSREENEFIKGLFRNDAGYFSRYAMQNPDSFLFYQAGPWIGGFKSGTDFEWVTGERRAHPQR
jgi:hypothetical protein